MLKNPVQCSHSCKEVCTAIEIAAINEKNAILQYATLRDQCTYPDVKAMLNELIIDKKRSIELLDRTKELMKSKFEVIEQIREGFEME